MVQQHHVLCFGRLNFFFLLLCRLCGDTAKYNITSVRSVPTATHLNRVSGIPLHRSRWSPQCFQLHRERIFPPPPPNANASIFECRKLRIESFVLWCFFFLVCVVGLVVELNRSQHSAMMLSSVCVKSVGPLVLSVTQRSRESNANEKNTLGLKRFKRCGCKFQCCIVSGVRGAFSKGGGEGCFVAKAPNAQFNAVSLFRLVKQKHTRRPRRRRR